MISLSKPRVLILFAAGTNRDRDLAYAFRQVGADAQVMPLQALRNHEVHWNDYQILAVAGGFSYADALGAGKLLAFDMFSYFAEEVQGFIATGKPVIGICNGFQALVKAGILPFDQLSIENKRATLTFNDSGHFECRWVSLKPVSQKCLWTNSLSELIACPVAHGEGKFYAPDHSDVSRLVENDQIALTYCTEDGAAAERRYPINPNGSILDIAGICNPAGNVLGLMPHPEDHVFDFQAPKRKWAGKYLGLPLFENAIRFVQ